MVSTSLVDDSLVVDEKRLTVEEGDACYGYREGVGRNYRPDAE